MEMIDRWPHLGDEIQLHDLTPEESYRQSKRDRSAVRRAIARYYLKRIFKF